MVGEDMGKENRFAIILSLFMGIMISIMSIVQKDNLQRVSIKLMLAITIFYVIGWIAQVVFLKILSSHSFSTSNNQEYYDDIEQLPNSEEDLE